VKYVLPVDTKAFLTKFLA